MNKSIYLIALACITAMAGCNEQRFKKEKDGTEYKVVENSKGRLAVPGDFMQVNIIVKYGDSLLFSSIESSSPRFLPFDTMQMPPYFRVVHEGDSLVIRELTDSMIRRGQAAPFMKSGKYIYQTFKVVKLFKTKEAADSAAKPFMEAARVISYRKAEEGIEKNIASQDSLVKVDDKAINDYMSARNLKGTKTKWGTYVVIETPGNGPAPTDKDVAEVNYTGRTFADSTFDSNTDKKFGHVEPLYVDMGDFNVIIAGWIDGLRMMQKGSKGKIIIPSYLAYGAGGRPPKIGPNENLVFDMEVTNVLTHAQYEEIMKKQQEEMMQKQQEMMKQRQEKMKEEQEKSKKK